MLIMLFVNQNDIVIEKNIVNLCYKLLQLTEKTNVLTYKYSSAINYKQNNFIFL